MTESRKERMMHILEKASALYEQFLQIVQDDIIEPLAKGDKDKCRENLKKFGKKVTMAEIVRIVVRGANLLTMSTIKSFEAVPDKSPRLSEEYMARRLEHFNSRIEDMNRRSALHKSAV